MKKLAIVTTHPIQYNGPWFKLLQERKDIEIKVFYTWSQTKEFVKDRTFGKEIKWDIPLLEGYDYEFVENMSKNPGSHHFRGIDCPRLIQKIESFKPNAILFIGWNFKSHLKAIRYFHGKIPVWFRGDSTLLDEKAGIKKILRRIFLRWVYRKVDKAFYVGKANKEYFIKHGFKERNLIYTPHSIDIGRFNDNPSRAYEEQARVWRKKLGFEESDLVVLFAGKFQSKKQPDFLVKSIIEANKIRKSKIYLLLVGNGPLEPKLRELSANNESLKFLPFQNQSIMPVVYRLGDVFCLPSNGPGETWGLAINEAMASNRSAIVSSKVGSNADLVKQGETGFSFNYDKKRELINILATLDLDSINEIGSNANLLIQEFNFEKIIDPIIQETKNLK